MKPEQIKEMLNLDPLAEAEKITGKSYKNDEKTSNIGMGLHIMINKEKERLLIGMNDTHFNMKEDEFLQICKQNKFEIILKEPFLNEEGTEEHLYCLFNYDLSILVVFDTFTWTDSDGSFKKSGKSVPPPSVNSGTMYFNFATGDYKSTFGFHLSGGLITKGKNRDLVIVDKNLNHVEKPDNLIEPTWDDNTSYEEYIKQGKIYDENFRNWMKDNNYLYTSCNYRDIREGMMFTINQLKKEGFFIKTWLQKPFLWILNYMDSKVKGYDYEKLTNTRIEKFPVDVQKTIGYIK